MYMIMEDVRVVSLASFVVDVVGIHPDAEVGVLGVHDSRAEFKDHAALHLPVASAMSDAEIVQGRGSS